MEGGIIGTILGSVLGFLASLLPDVFGLIRDRMSSKPPTPPASTPSFDGQVTDGSTIVAPEDTSPDLHEEVGPMAHFKVLDFLRASVRPVLTYLFFGLFAYIKLVALHHALVYDHVEIAKLLPILWDEGTEALFAAVIAFWFGSRAMMRYRRKQ
jgi:hypothetical protein